MNQRRLSTSGGFSSRMNDGNTLDFRFGLIACHNLMIGDPSYARLLLSVKSSMGNLTRKGSGMVNNDIPYGSKAMNNIRSISSVDDQI